MRQWPLIFNRLSCISICTCIWSKFITQSPSSSARCRMALLLAILPCLRWRGLLPVYHSLRNLPVIAVLLLLFLWKHLGSALVQDWRKKNYTHKVFIWISSLFSVVLCYLFQFFFSHGIRQAGCSCDTFLSFQQAPSLCSCHLLLQCRREQASDW